MFTPPGLIDGSAGPQQLASVCTVDFGRVRLSVCVCVGVTVGGRCESSQWQCGDSTRCISVTYVCDADQDCADNSDELNCRTGTDPVPIQYSVKTFKHHSYFFSLVFCILLHEI